jgi:hypothetical protein
MTDEQREAVGWFSDEILTHPHFITIVEEFERTVAHEILNSFPPATSEREAIYWTYNGAKQFLDYMRTFVKFKNDISRQRAIQAQIDEEGLDMAEDALEDEID